MAPKTKGIQIFGENEQFPSRMGLRLVSCPENKFDEVRSLQGLKPDSILRPYAGAESPGLLKTNTTNLRDNMLA
jgi:hypothetical protein